jgi:predicted dienelactone hydrolase
MQASPRADFRARLRRWSAGVLLACPLLAHAGGVGIAAIRATDPVGGGAMPGFVFYPSTRSTGTTAMGPYDVAAEFDAPAQPGAKPLVVISHGHGGTNLGHHDLAEVLAAHGFIVATLEHPRDNFHDQAGNGQPEVMAGRPRQVSAMVDAVLADPKWGKLVDRARIGVAGFSAGGYTSLLLVGAKPRFDRFVGYCQRHREDRDTCSVVEGLAADGGLDAALAALQAGMSRWGEVADPRIRAAFAMAPQSIVFDRAGAAAIDRPVFLYYGTADRVLLPDENAQRLAPLVPTLAGVKTIEGAGHWVFLAPCTPALAREAGEICRDPPGVDRAKVHAQVDADALAFFRKALGDGAR